jgi:predicted nucleotidyltransferase component of viral defense system
VLLPPKQEKYHNVWGLDFKVRVMDEREICAEKIRAMSERARYRDYYDLYWLLKKFKPDLEEITSFIVRKEIQKPITKQNILKNWEVVGSQKTREMDHIYYSQSIDDEQILIMLAELPFKEINPVV